MRGGEERGEAGQKTTTREEFTKEREERKQEWNTKWSQDKFETDSEGVSRSIEARKMKAWISALALLPSMILNVA